MIFYTDKIGLPSSKAGLAIALAVIWDAVADPLVGTLSDRSSRWPWIFGGAPFLLASFWLLFHPPALSENFLFLYLLVTYVLFNTFFTVVGIPYSAIAGDSPRENTTEFIGWRILLGNFGSIFGTAIPGFYLAKGLGYSEPVVWLITAFIPLLLLTYWGVRSIPPSKNSTAPALLDSIRNATRNTPFLLLSFSYLVANIGLAVNSTLALYFYRYSLRLEENAIQKILITFMVVFSLFLFAWIKIGDWFGKRRTLIYGVSTLALVVCFSYPFMPQQNSFYPMLIGIVTGLLVGVVLLLDSLLVDLSDYGTVFSRKNELGFYYGFWRMSGKASRAVALAFSGYLLHWIGFQPNQDQSAFTMQTLALCFGPGVGLFLLLSALICWNIDFEETKAHRVRKILARRKELEK